MARSGPWYTRSWWMGATVCAAVVLFALVASMATAHALSPTPPDPDFVPGEILIKLKSAVPLPHPSEGVAFVGSASICLAAAAGPFGASPCASQTRLEAYADAGSGAIFVAVGHSNGDAKLDLAAGVNDTYAALSIVLGNGDGTFQTPVRYATGTDYASVAVGDLNGDGIFSRDRGRRAV